jgi:hypothetical protein
MIGARHLPLDKFGQSLTVVAERYSELGPIAVNRHLMIWVKLRW